MSDLVRYQPPTSSIELAPSAWKLAEKIAATDFVPPALRGKPEAVLACILAGHEAGISPMQALSKIHIIEGRPAMAAELMRALVLQHGHEISYVEKSSTRCIIEGRRRGSERWTKVEWTLDDAKRGGLDGKQNWRKWPRAMLDARATAELCRMIFADVLAGISYTVEELSDGDTVEGMLDLGPAEPSASPASSTTKRATAKAGKAITRGPVVADDPDERPPAPRGELPDLPPDAEPVVAELVVEDDPELVVEDETAGEILDADVVDEDDWPSGDWPSEAPPADARRYTGPQIVAIRLGDRFGIKGNTKEARDERLAAIAILLGRTITSSKDLTPAEISTVIETIDAWPADRPLFPNDPPRVDPAPVEAPSNVTSIDEAPRRRSTPSPETWDGDRWRAFLAERKVKVTETMREAQRLASLRTPAAQIGTLDDVAGAGIATELIGWIEDTSLDRSTK